MKFSIGDLVCIRETSHYNRRPEESRGLVIDIEPDIFESPDLGGRQARIKVMWFAINGHSFSKSKFVTCEPESSLEILSKCGD